MLKKFNFIYKTTNLTNGKIYIGQHVTNNLNDNYLGSGKVLKRAIKKYGRKNFKREILEMCNIDIDTLNKREEFWINKLDSLYPNGYNLVKNGRGGIPVGTKHSKETINKMKLTWKKKKDSGEDLGERLRGIKKSPEFCKVVSERMKGDNNPSRKYGAHNKGISWNEEIKNKISTIHKINKTFVANKNHKFKPIDDEIWAMICSDIETGSEMEFVSFLSGVSKDRIIRNLFFKGLILYEDLPNYIRKHTNKESFGVCA